MAIDKNTTKLVAALGDLLSAYGQIDEMLDGFAAAGEGLTAKEAKTQKRSNSARDKALRVYEKMLSKEPVKK